MCVYGLLVAASPSIVCSVCLMIPVVDTLTVPLCWVCGVWSCPVFHRLLSSYYLHTTIYAYTLHHYTHYTHCYTGAGERGGHHGLLGVRTQPRRPKHHQVPPGRLIAHQPGGGQPHWYECSVCISFDSRGISNCIRKYLTTSCTCTLFSVFADSIYMHTSHKQTRARDGTPNTESS